MLWLKQLRCKHQFEFVYNLHGDVINLHGGKRSAWHCPQCAKTLYRDNYVPPVATRLADYFGMTLAEARKRAPVGVLLLSGRAKFAPFPILRNSVYVSVGRDGFIRNVESSKL